MKTKEQISASIKEVEKSIEAFSQNIKDGIEDWNAEKIEYNTAMRANFRDRLMILKWVLD